MALHEPHDQHDNRCKEQDATQIRERFHEGHRIAHLPLDIVVHKSCRVHRHSPGFEAGRLKNERIHLTVSEPPEHIYFRKLIAALLERSQGDTGAYVHASRFPVQTEGIHAPALYQRKRILRQGGEVREGQTRAAIHVLQFETVFELVRNQDRIPLLKGFQESFSLRHYGRQDKHECQQQSHLFLNKAIKPFT